MLQKKIDDISVLLDSLFKKSLGKVLELAREKNALEMVRYTVFKRALIKNDDIEKLLNDDYEPILVRIEDFSADHHYREAMFLGLLFLKDYNSDTTLYGEDINITKEPVTKILYFLCRSLLKEKQPEMCLEYIKLLGKIAIIYPDYFDEFLNDDIEDMLQEIKYINKL